MSSKSFFYAENLTAGYNGNNVIKGITFSVDKYSLTGLIGANGCGKTTLLRSIANQIKHEGACYLQNEKIETLPIKTLAKKISYIPQKSGITISLPVIDVVMMGFNPELKLFQQPSAKQRKIAEEAIESVGLSRYTDTDFLNLSAGERQLVFLARTLIENTSLLLLDEPDSALDFHNRYSIVKKIKDMISGNEKAGILCLHDPVLALEFCDQLVLIKDSKCLKILNPKTDSLEEMENALKEIYGDVSLVRCTDRTGKAHLSLLWEGRV